MNFDKIRQIAQLFIDAAKKDMEAANSSNPHISALVFKYEDIVKAFWGDTEIAIETPNLDKLCAALSQVAPTELVATTEAKIANTAQANEIARLLDLQKMEAERQRMKEIIENLESPKPVAVVSKAVTAAEVVTEPNEVEVVTEPNEVEQKANEKLRAEIFEGNFADKGELEKFFNKQRVGVAALAAYCKYYKIATPEKATKANYIDAVFVDFVAASSPMQAFFEDLTENPTEPTAND
jgi:hypothetical protein